MLRVRSDNTERHWPVQELRAEGDAYKVKFADTWRRFTLDGRGPPNTRYVLELSSP